MRAYFKSLAAFRTSGSADVLAASLCLGSVSGDASSVTVVGDFERSITGDWLIYDGHLYVISKTKPQDGRTLLTLAEPIEAFARPLVWEEPAGVTTVGGMIAAVLTAEFKNQPDAVYAFPYLSVSNSDTTPYIAPDVDDKGAWSLVEYIRTVRQVYGIRINFSVDGDTLSVTISKGTTTPRVVVFGDGHSQLNSAAYSKSGLAKITVIQPEDTGEVDSDGNPILEDTTTDWYLDEDGSVSTTIPGRRAKGEWSLISVSAGQDQEQKVRETFAKNSASHRVEFYSDRELDVFDPCSIRLAGEVLTSYISYKGKDSTDARYLYKSGELATRASEKLRGGV